MRRPAVENCGLSVAKPRGRFTTSPRKGALQMKPATSSCRAFCAVSTHGRWPRPWGRVARRRPAVGNCGLRVRNRRARLGAAPPGGLVSEACNFQLPGVLCDFHPRTMAAAKGRWARHGRPLKTAAFSCETAGGGSCQPPSGGLADEARNFQLPGVSCGFHPRVLAAAEGQWARHGQQLKTAAFGRRSRRGGWSQPPAGGLASEARNFQLPGVLCDFHPRTMAAAEDGGPRHGRQLKTAAFTCETASGGWSQPPPGGFANEARNFQLPGVLCGFHPRTLAAAGGAGLRTANRWKLRPSVAKPPGRLGAAPARGLCKRSPQLLVAGRFVRLPPTDAGRGRGAMGPGAACS